MTLATEFKKAEDSPGFLLWQVTNQWQARQRAALEPFELTHVQFVLIASLAWLKSNTIITQEELARHAKTDRMMTSQVVRVLEKKGWIKRERHPKDKRAFALNITPSGLELVNKAVEEVEHVDKMFFATLGTHRKQFTKYLAQLAH